MSSCKIELIKLLPEKDARQGQILDIASQLVQLVQLACSDGIWLAWTRTYNIISSQIYSGSQQIEKREIWSSFLPSQASVLEVIQQQQC